MKPAQYRKLIAAGIGLASIVAARYGFDMEPHAQILADAALALLTMFGVYRLPNAPKEKP